MYSKIYYYSTLNNVLKTNFLIDIKQQRFTLYIVLNIRYTPEPLHIQSFLLLQSIFKLFFRNNYYITSIEYLSNYLQNYKIATSSLIIIC